ncbi:hypothetical protein J1N35_011005 [Gossypium stocksii]|uniref:Uncharacterized protein n=1 Tax=Gossypium stocksii TaxID=47602 RepID=A0A9D3W2N6_9ROSI|nr:hypothetical protein J1N35_011005 [Gossypium stocksii]
MPTSMPVSIPKSMLTYTGFVTPYTYKLIVSQTPTTSLFYRGGSYVQPYSDGVEDTLWEARTKLYSSMEEGNRGEGEGNDEDEVEADGGGEDKDEDNSGDEDEQKGLGYGKEDEDSDDDQVDEFMFDANSYGGLDTGSHVLSSEIDGNSGFHTLCMFYNLYTSLMFPHPTIAYVHGTQSAWNLSQSQVSFVRSTQYDATDMSWFGLVCSVTRNSRFRLKWHTTYIMFALVRAYQGIWCITCFKYAETSILAVPDPIVFLADINHILSIFIKDTTPMAGTIMDIGRLLGRKPLFQWSKGDFPFGLVMVVVIEKLINNYNSCRTDSSLTSTFIETSAFVLRVLLCPYWC